MDEAKRGSGPQGINVWLASLQREIVSEQNLPSHVKLAKEQKDEAILYLLAKLSQHYWVPNESEAMNEDMFLQYVGDLREYALDDIIGAISDYRRNGDNKFFPRVGELRKIIETIPAWDVNSKSKHIAERRAYARAEMAEKAGEIQTNLLHCESIKKLK